MAVPRGTHRAVRDLRLDFGINPDSAQAHAQAELDAQTERNLAAQQFDADAQRFKMNYGYDIKLDKPVEGGHFEYEQIHPPIQGAGAGVQGAGRGVQEAGRGVQEALEGVQEALEGVQEAPREP